MSYDLANDADNLAGPRLPGISPNNLRRAKKVALGLTALVVVVLVLWWVRGAYTDWLWFDRLGLGSVFIKIFFLKTWLFIGGTLVAGATLCLNLFVSVRYSQGPTTRNLGADTSRLIRASIFGVAGLAVLIGSPIFGAVAAGRWETFLLYFNKVSFGVTDPQFGLDVSFYVVTLRMLHFIQGWFMGLFIASIVASLFLYAAVYALRGVKLVVAPRMLKHVAILGALLMVSIALGHVLDVYELVFSSNGAVFGATYADIHARIPALWLMTAIAAVAAFGFVISNYYGGLRLMAGAFSLWLIVVVLANFVYPGLFQRFQVEPDEFTREAPYIERNLEGTRTAYGLDNFNEIEFQAKSELDPKVLAEDRPTLDSLRLWDLQPLLDAYNQLQFIGLYYNFPNMDSDRYLIDGELRQVLLAAREIDSGNLPADAQNWVNRKLQYTHGYGVAMSPAMGLSPGEGRPEYLLQDIPIKGDILLNRPEIYYGETPASFAIVNTAMREVDPEAEYQNYQGEGGVPLNSSWRRFLYAWQFGDINIFLSDQVSAESKILYHRRIADRVGTIAPFLRLDPDPYPVLGEEGKVWWLQDAYTTTDRYPYSTRLGLTSPSLAGDHGPLSYIHNSVKVVIDAYNGGVQYYVMEPDEPLIKMYRRAFPDLFQDLEEMPSDLRGHLRYPLLQFSAQSQVDLRYHVTDSLVFFNQAEQWGIPLETRFGKRGVQVTPAYLLLKLPGEKTEEFVLTLPFTLAAQKKNLVG